MERAEKVGFGVAVVGHVLLFAVLSLGLLAKPLPTVKLNDPIDVQLVDDVGLVSGAPKPATEAPATSQAPDVGPPDEAAPAEAEPAPPTPAPPPPPAPKPEPKKPTPPKPEPKPEPKPKPVPPAPAPKPAPKPKPKPKPEPAEDEAKPAKPEKPAKPTKADKPDKPAKAAPAKSKTSKDSSAQDAPAKAAPAKASAKTGAGKGKKTSGDLLGDDFMKGITPEKSTSKAQAPRAAAVSATQMAGLVGAIQRQLLPCADRRSSPGPGSDRITTRLRLRMNKDGSLAAAPEILGQVGTDDENSRYAKRVGELAIGIARECSPLRLPAELYDTGNGQGWNDIVIRYKLPG